MRSNVYKPTKIAGLSHEYRRIHRRVFDITDLGQSDLQRLFQIFEGRVNAITGYANGEQW